MIVASSEVKQEGVVDPVWIQSTLDIDVAIRIECDPNGYDELVNLAKQVARRRFYEAGWMPCLPVTDGIIAVTRDGIGAWCDEVCVWKHGEQTIRARTRNDPTKE